MSPIKFDSPKDIQAIEVLLYFLKPQIILALNLTHRNGQDMPSLMFENKKIRNPKFLCTQDE